MRVFRDPDAGSDHDAIKFALGAAGGLALGVLISRALPKRRVFSAELRDRARSVARRLRPGRLRRLVTDQMDLDRLEDSVLDAFLADSVLSERGVDIGAISHGIIELSGSVWTEEESERAVNLANRIPGVHTVVNRMEVENSGHRPSGRRPLDEDQLNGTFIHHEARVGGMGRRRQGVSTDPDRRDDSQHMSEDALAAADRSQWSDEGFAHVNPRVQERDEVQEANRTHYSEDELDNQDPHGKHAKRTLDRQPQELNSDSRVGDPWKPGTELRLDRSDLSIDEAPPRDREG